MRYIKFQNEISINSVDVIIVVASKTLTAIVDNKIMMKSSYFVDIVRLDRFVEDGVEIIEKGHDLFKENVNPVH